MTAVLVALALIEDHHRGHPQITPCGASRQVLQELAPDTRVMANLVAKVYLATVTKLLHTPFGIGPRT